MATAQPHVPPYGLRPDSVQYIWRNCCRGVETTVIGVSAGEVKASTRSVRSATSTGSRSAATCAAVQIIPPWSTVEVLSCGDLK